MHRIISRGEHVTKTKGASIGSAFCILGAVMSAGEPAGADHSE
jgi:hypothetical protein